MNSTTDDGEEEKKGWLGSHPYSSQWVWQHHPAKAQQQPPPDDDHIAQQQQQLQ